MKAKLGPEAVTMATGHKIEVISYTMVKTKSNMTTPCGPQETPRGEKGWKQLKRQAKQLGYQLVPTEPKAA